MSLEPSWPNQHTPWAMFGGKEVGELNCEQTRVRRAAFPPHASNTVFVPWYFPGGIHIHSPTSTRELGFKKQCTKSVSIRQLG